MIVSPKRDRQESRNKVRYFFLRKQPNSPAPDEEMHGEADPESSESENLTAVGS